MSNLRWILLFSGFAILFLLYFSGRPRRDHANKSRPSGKLPEKDFSDADTYSNDQAHGQLNSQPNDHAIAAGVHPHSYSDAYVSDGYSAEAYAREAYPQDASHRSSYESDASVTDQYAPGYAPGAHEQGAFAQVDIDQVAIDQDRYASTHPAQEAYAQAQPAEQYGVDAHTGYPNTHPESHVARPSSSHHGVPPISAAASDGFSAADSFGPIDPSDLDRPAASREDFITSRDEVQQEAGLQRAAGQGFSNPISQKIAAFTHKLAQRRSIRANQKSVNRNHTKKGSGSNDKILLLHVMAPNNGIIDGTLLLEVIESRGYHYGDLDIFHSLHEGKTVFSIAKVVEPGRFDINDISSFDTPGLALILRLPGPIQGDVAFEVMMSEAHELAAALGCRVLDSGRSTLSRQTVSHLRESILQYLHRQKYLSKAVT